MNQPLGPINLILLAPAGLAVLVATRVLFGRARQVPADPMQVLLTAASSILFVVAAVGAVLGLVGIWILLIPLPIVALVLFFMVLDRGRHSAHRALVWALAAAANRGIPLPEAARAFADETQGNTSHRSLLLAEALERGQPLAQAARIAWLRMSTAMRLTVRVAEPLGSLGPAMRQQMEDSQQVDLVLRDAIGRFFYLGILITVMNIVCTFMMLKIVPVYQRMFEEFGLRLPPLTRFVIEISKWFVQIGWVPILPLSLVIYPTFLLIATLYYVGYFPRNLPLVWRLFKRYDGALVMRSLALAVRRGVPMPEALRLVASNYPLSIVGNRLQMAADRVDAGMDWCASLLQTGLIGKADAAVLSSAQRVGNLDWALEEMAASAIRRQAYRVQVLVQILFPILLLTVGGFVFVFVAGLFWPLVTLINGLT